MVHTIRFRAGYVSDLQRPGQSRLERVRLEAGFWLERFYKTEYEARKLVECKKVMSQAEFSNFRRIGSGEDRVASRKVE